MTPPAISPDQATLAALATCVVVSLIVLAIAIAIGDLHPIRWIRARSAVIDLVLAWCHFEGYQVAGRIAAAARTANQWRRLQFGADQTPDWRVGELTGEQPTVRAPGPASDCYRCQMGDPCTHHETAAEVYTFETSIDEQNGDSGSLDDGDQGIDESPDEQRAAELVRNAEEWCRDHGLLDPPPAVDQPAGGDSTTQTAYLPRHRLGVVDGTDAQRARWAGPTAAYPAITTTRKPEGAAA